jgi:SPP1 gp7 family putative phage head morphogenesis protein
MRIICGKCRKEQDATEVVAMARYKCNTCGNVNEILNISVKEWVGFDYEEYLQEILDFIDKDEFVNLRAEDVAQLRAGKMSEKQINRLKLVLKDNLREGRSMRDIAEDIARTVKPKDLEVRNAEGNVVRRIPGEARSINIARTETTRASNEGAVARYKEAGITEIGWVASMSDRTCPICENLNGQIFPIDSPTKPPAHNMCRCTTVPIVKLE